MRTSDSVDKIIPALFEARRVFGPVLKDTKNEFLKSTYANHMSIVRAVEDALIANNMFTTEDYEPDDDGGCMVCRIWHVSGQWIDGRAPVRVGDEKEKGKSVSQMWGSAQTYSRRYALINACSLSPIKEDDDDGHGAGRGRHRQQRQPRNGSMSDVAAERDQMPQPEQMPQTAEEVRIEAQAWVDANVEKVRKAESANWLSGVLRNGTVLHLKDTHSDLYEELEAEVQKRLASLTGVQPGKASGPDIAGSKFVNGDAHG